jgi:isopentenyldiphosphate isomerase
MEMIDILDSNGKPTGEVASREEVHKKGLWHRTNHIWLVNNHGEILLQKRADNIESFPNKYHISAGGLFLRGTRV